MIRVGIGGWTYEPWRGSFFPVGLAHARELEYASRKLTAIEINGTYYRTQSPASYAKWAAETPEDFIFSVKALRFCTNRKVLAEAGESVAKFLASGLGELGEKLGPILWQFMPTKRFERDDFAAFLDLLPDRLEDGRRLRHAVQVRHDSFHDPAFIELARAHGVAVVFADSAKYPTLADPTADFAYLRLEDAKAEVETGYGPGELDRYAAMAKTLAAGETPEGPDYVAGPSPKLARRDVFVFMINGAKQRAPAAALALMDRL